MELSVAPEPRLVWVDGRHRDAVRGLFEAVFGHPLSAAEWDWKYGQGHGQALALEQDGVLTAHFGGLSRRIVHEGELRWACQVCDVAVAAQARGSLRRKGALYTLAAAFLDAQIGWQAKHLLGFGFPTHRHYVVAERLGLYGPVDEVHAAQWPAQALAGWRAPCLRELTEADLTGAMKAEVDALWERMRAGLAECTLGVRDADWLAYRYLRHPRFQYQLLAVRSRWRDRLLGALVLRAHAQHLEWVDLVAAPADWPQLLQVVRAQAAAQGLPRVEVWSTQSQLPRWQAFKPTEARSLGIQVPGNTHSPGPALETQRGRWFLMAGDTDFR